MSTVSASGMNYSRVIQVIETVSVRGKGTEEDTCRPVKQYWSLDGELLAENDPCASEKPFDIKREIRSRR